jgi:arsenite methyltransferase
MNEILQYNEDASNKLLDMYRTPDIQNLRLEFMKFVKVGPGKRILDVGSGPGFLSLEMANVVKPYGLVCGIDISDLMLHLSKTYCIHQPRVKFIKAGVAHLPFPD